MAKTGGVLHFAPWQCCQSGIGADVGNMCVRAGALSGRFDVCEGWSSRLRYLTRGIRRLVQMNIPYVPHLVNSSAVGSVMTHANGAIVIDCVYCVRSLVSWRPVLAMLILFNHHLVTY
jgi:hypothetical protein